MLDGLGNVIHRKAIGAVQAAAAAGAQLRGGIMQERIFETRNIRTDPFNPLVQAAPNEHFGIGKILNTAAVLPLYKVIDPHNILHGGNKGRDPIAKQLFVFGKLITVVAVWIVLPVAEFLGINIPQPKYDRNIVAAIVAAVFFFVSTAGRSKNITITGTVDHLAGQNRLAALLGLEGHTDHAVAFHDRLAY